MHDWFTIPTRLAGAYRAVSANALRRRPRYKLQTQLSLPERRSTASTMPDDFRTIAISRAKSLVRPRQLG